MRNHPSLSPEQRKYMELERRQVVKSLKYLKSQGIKSLTIDEAVKFVQGKPIIVSKVKTNEPS